MAAGNDKGKLSLPQMRELVLDEMEQIPRRPKDTQRYLRMAYWVSRMNSLGKNAQLPNDRSKVMENCLEELAKLKPGMEFQYNENYFGIRSEE
jgi:hypothetical protein